MPADPLRSRWNYASFRLSMSLSLREYAESSKRSLRAIAVAAGVDTGDIYKIADGQVGWTAETADRIMTATDGKVTPNDLLKTRKEFLAEQERIEREARRKRVGEAGKRKAPKRPFAQSKAESEAA